MTAFVARLKAFEQSLPRGIEETDAINVLSGMEMGYGKDSDGILT